MNKGIFMIVAALGMIVAGVVLGGQDWTPKEIDFSDMPKEPNAVECKQISSAYSREMDAITRAAAEALQAAPAPTAQARFVGAGDGFGNVSKAGGSGLGGLRMQLKKLERVEKYLTRECGGK
ncbi:hypothetical protein C8J27_101273 [Rhodobacter aestuarii]|uniref:Uncharacterized protein n=1 Tax=Rhodobacter aestuarii TaxID=453582 RepID=A0A1N7J5C8_9RHOB|nr:hypothetical protein [Rhodobacter aestuarii]PTV97163.1 hypothetical protein C8J27_101273 [Rhodobacter aestuarii]SIS44540.1 hypothetical protein SAMN05421580_101369 [Rhodobacter aestuarii]